MVTYFSCCLTPGRVFASLVMFCVILCTCCNFYQVYWDSVCSNSNNNPVPGAPTDAGHGQLGNYNMVILFPTSTTRTQILVTVTQDKCLFSVVIAT